MISYNQSTIFQKIITIPNIRTQTLASNPYELLPAFNGYYTILNVAVDYDNIDVTIIGGYDWLIANLNAYTLSGGNYVLMNFIWSSDNRGRSGIMQGINGATSYIGNFRNEPIYLTSQSDDLSADFFYANINIVYTQTSI